MTESQGHPAYKSILDALPESLHAVILPTLQEWDKGVQQKLQDVRAEYEPYKKFIDAKVDPTYLEQAANLAHNLQENPEKVIAQINSEWKLGFATPEELAELQAAKSISDDGDDFNLNDPEFDISKHPEFIAMKQLVEGVNTTLTKQQEQDKYEQEVQEFEEYLDGLEAAHKEGGFNRTLVTAFMSQGLDGEAAVAEYRKVLAGTVTPPSQDNNELPPVAVMGGNGTAGSGLAQNTVDFGKMSKNDVNASVEAMFAAAQQNNQG